MGRSKAKRSAFIEVPTIGDGNCALNAFALAFRDLINHNLLPPIPDVALRPLLKVFAENTGKHATQSALKAWLRTASDARVQRALSAGFRDLYVDILLNSDTYSAQAYRSAGGNQAMLLGNDFANYVRRRQGVRSNDANFRDDYFEGQPAFRKKFEVLYAEIETAAEVSESLEAVMQNDPDNINELAFFDLDAFIEERKNILFDWWSTKGYKLQLRSVGRNGEHITNHALGVLSEYFRLSCDIKSTNVSRQYRASNSDEFHGYYPEGYIESLSAEQREKLRRTINGTTLLQGNTSRIGRIEGDVSQVLRVLKDDEDFQEFDFGKLLDILAANYSDAVFVHFRHSARRDHWSYRRPRHFTALPSRNTALQLPPSLHSLAVAGSKAFRVALGQELPIRSFNRCFRKIRKLRDAYIEENVTSLGVATSRVDNSGFMDLVKSKLGALSQNDFDSGCLATLKLLLADDSISIDLRIPIYLVKKFPRYANAIWNGYLLGRDAQEKCYYTLLHKAVASNKVEWVTDLLEVDTILVNESSCGYLKHSAGFGTPLSLACSNKAVDIKIVRALIASGADINLCNSKKQSPMMMAAKHGRFDILLELLSQPNAHVLARDEKGRSVLEYLTNSKLSILSGLRAANSDSQRLEKAKDLHFATLLQILNFAKSECYDSSICSETSALAEELLFAYNDFTEIRSPTPKQAKDFVLKCNDLIKAKSSVIAKSTRLTRLAWNLLISASVIGVVVIAANALYAKATKGAFELLYQPQAEHVIDKARVSLKHIDNAAAFTAAPAA